MEEKLNKLLVEGARAFNIMLDDRQIEQYTVYKDVLKEWNEKINLTAIEDDRDVVIKHFIDSLSVAPQMEKLLAENDGNQLKVVDIGTGAGFPGIPLKISCKSLKVTLLDSLDKRVKFLSEVINRLDLPDIEAVHGRAEEYGQKAETREKFDVSIARAVASLPVLLEYCLPFVRQGGMFIAMKGSNTDETASSKKALELLGGKVEEILELSLPFSDIKRNIILVRKLRQTPTKYPRKAGKPSKEPLI